MWNLIGEPEPNSVINCNETRHSKNQIQVKGHTIPKFLKSDFVIFHQNIRALNNCKFDELSFPLTTNPPHTICFTKHHLDTNEIDKIVLPNYRFGSKFCRNSFKNGDVCIFTHESIQSTNMNLNGLCKKKKYLEICAVKLHLPSHEICVITTYRSPSGNYQYFIDELETILNMIYSNSVEIIICGDININCLINSTSKQLLDSLLDSYGLHSTFKFPTRIQNNSYTTIDNIFIDTFKFSNFTVKPIINGLSDHDTQSLILHKILVPNTNTHFYYKQKI